MTRETKAGLVVSCSFLCLVGIVLFSKLNDKEASATTGQEDGGFAQQIEEPKPVANDAPDAALDKKEGSPAAQGENRQSPVTKDIVRADFRVNDEHGSPVPSRSVAEPGKEPAAKEPEVTAVFAPVGASTEPPVATVTPAAAESPALHRTPPAAAAETASTTGTAASPSGEEATPGREKTPLVTIPGWPPISGSSGAPTTPGLAASAAGEGLSKSVITTPGSPTAKTGTLLPTADPETSPGGDSKSALPAAPAASGSPSSSSVTPKVAETSAPPAPPKDWTDITPKRGASSSTMAPTESPKSGFQWPAPPPASGIVPKPTEPASWSDKGFVEGKKTDSTTPHQSPAMSGDLRGTGPSGPYKTPATTDSISATSPSALTPSARPSGSSFGSTSLDTSTPNFNPGSSSRLPASSPEFGSRPGSNTGLPSRNSWPNSTSPSPFEAGVEKVADLGVPAARNNGAIQRPSAAPAALVSDSSNRTLPPLGAPAAPLRAAGSPMVESYDESTYVSKPNDTFRTISQQFYRTDGYEAALVLFNRNHPLASNAVRQNPPILQPGEPIYIPPGRILEKYYGAISADPRTPAPPAPAPAPEQANITGLVRTATLSPVGAGGGTLYVDYRVHEGGEMLAEIARRTLGSSERWWEIRRLNPRFDPKDPVPAGSQLRLPRDARVDPPDVP